MSPSLAGQDEASLASVLSDVEVASAAEEQDAEVDDVVSATWLSDAGGDSDLVSTLEELSTTDDFSDDYDFVDETEGETEDDF